MKYLFGILLIVLGFVVIWKTNWFLQMFGRNAWAEEKFGYGGTWTMYKILGVLLIIVAFLVMSGGAFKVLDFLFIPG
ncbi:MAG: hypothetical protein HYV32_02395 [Candidatus Kerfeldbacteria bacterium]|nr:hypothetical protein [Candidatus Kerfeldbacteria bacterium]